MISKNRDFVEVLDKDVKEALHKPIHECLKVKARILVRPYKHGFILCG